MSGRRVRRHFSQLSEFERGRIIGIKTAGWLTRRVARQVDRSKCAVRTYWEQWTRDGTHLRSTRSGASRKKTKREDQRIVQKALLNPTVTRSTIQSDVGVPVVPQTISRSLAEANLQSKRPVRVLPLTPNIGDSVCSGAMPERRGMSQIAKTWCLVMNPGSFWGQMKTAYGCGGALVNGTIPPTLSRDTLPSQQA
ncbi:hypothetical protein AVEN_136350-1 [Araneus ventricosus]|uniref:Transposase Tc1-like domain-containing protein n=1 Tax=Araneus ventricosus TaxID=182803 RepID=A0A4Y2E4G4_ARAVE|nr:hypothetical protein AVEN_136350-1 [Araneus ventricosus]